MNRDKKRFIFGKLFMTLFDLAIIITNQDFIQSAKLQKRTETNK